MKSNVDVFAYVFLMITVLIYVAIVALKTTLAIGRHEQPNRSTVADVITRTTLMTTSSPSFDKDNDIAIMKNGVTRSYNWAFHPGWLGSV